MIFSVLTATLTAGRYMYDNDHMDGDWWWMAIVMVAFWVAIAVLIVWLARGGTNHVQRHETPEEILKRRLADGSISIEEFETRRALLRDEQ